MRPFVFVALGLFALAPALTGCDALAGPEAASAAPTAHNGYFGSGHRDGEPCPEGDNGLIGSGGGRTCTPDPE